MDEFLEVFWRNVPFADTFWGLKRTQHTNHVSNPCFDEFWLEYFTELQHEIKQNGSAQFAIFQRIYIWTIQHSWIGSRKIKKDKDHQSMWWCSGKFGLRNSSAIPWTQKDSCFLRVSLFLPHRRNGNPWFDNEKMSLLPFFPPTSSLCLHCGPVLQQWFFCSKYYSWTAAHLVMQNTPETGRASDLPMGELYASLHL